MITLFVPEIVSWGGGERIYLSLSRYLHEQGLPHRFVSYYQSIDLQQYADWPLQIVQLKPRRNPLAKALAMRRYLAGEQAADSAAPTPLLIGIQAGLHAALLPSGLRYSVMILDTPSLLSKQAPGRFSVRRFKATYKSFENVAFRRSLGRAKPLITTTELMRKEMQELWRVDSIVSRQGVSIAPPTSYGRSIQEVSPLNIVSVSRLEGNKRIDWIINSLAKAERTDPPLSERVDWQMHIVGSGSELEPLKALAVSQGVADRVIFHGFVTEEQLAGIYRDANMAVMPGIQGYGLPALEALTRRIPVVLHKDSGVSEILTNSPWAAVFEGGEEGFYPALIQMVDAVATGTLRDIGLPTFPTDDDWSAEVARLCKWQ